MCATQRVTRSPAGRPCSKRPTSCAGERPARGIRASSLMVRSDRNSERSSEQSASALCSLQPPWETGALAAEVGAFGQLPLDGSHDDPRDAATHFAADLPGRPTVVRSENHIVHLQELWRYKRVVRDWRFVPEHLESSASNRVALQNIQQRRLIDNPTAGSIHKIRGWLHERKLARANQQMCRRVVVALDTHEIRLAHDRVHVFGPGNAELLLCLSVQPGPFGIDHVHAERAQRRQHVAGHPAQADQPNRFLRTTNAHERQRLLLPKSGCPDIAVRVHDAVSQGEDQANREIGSGLADPSVAYWRVSTGQAACRENWHAILACRVKVDGVRVAPANGDAPELRVGSEHFFGNGCFVHRQDVIGASGCARQVVDADLAIHVRIHRHLSVLFQNVDGDWRHRLDDEHTWFHGRYGPHARRCWIAAFFPNLPERICAARQSRTTLAEMMDVCSAWSYGGEHSTTSMPARPGWDTSRTRRNASRGRRPPGSGHPVPGTKPASITSISKDRYTAFAPVQARSSAISATLSTPSRSTSPMVTIAVPRSRPTLTPARGACQPPIPICTRLTAGAFGMFVAWNHGVVCIRSSRSCSWVSTWRSKWMIPTLPSTHGARPRTVG